MTSGVEKTGGFGILNAFFEDRSIHQFIWFFSPEIGYIMKFPVDLEVFLFVETYKRF